MKKIQPMTTLTLKLELDQALIATWRNADAPEQASIQKRVHQFVENLLREQSKKRLLAVMEELQTTAAKNGLTEEILDELLADHA